jgi:hypothetical protein
MAQFYRTWRYENRDYCWYRRWMLKCVTVSTCCRRESSHIFQRHNRPAAPSWHSCLVILPVHVSEEHFDCFENYIVGNSVGKHVSLHSSAYITHHTKFTQVDLSRRDVTWRHAWIWMPLTIQCGPRCNVRTFNSPRAFGLRAPKVVNSWTVLYIKNSFFLGGNWDLNPWFLKG